MTNTQFLLRVLFSAPLRLCGKNSWLVSLASIALAAPATFADEPAPPVFAPEIQPADLRSHVEYLASDDLRGRSGDDARVAADYIVAQFRQRKLSPVFADGNFYQSIPGTPNEQGQRPEIGRNVGAWLEGRDPVLKHEFIVLGVHFDHLGERNGHFFPGADDNASGVAMMLEVARRLSAAAERPRRSVMFVGFDLEEQLLWGSRWFAAHPPRPLAQVKLFLTADMIGRSLGDLPLPAVFVLGTEHAPALRTTLQQIGRPEGLEIARLGADYIGTRSDYGSFRDRQIPFLFFSTGEHPDYHTPRDTAARLDFAKAARVSSLILHLVRHAANANAVPAWTDEPESDLDEARTLARITSLLLEVEPQRPLSDVQRYLVTTVQNRTRRMLEAGRMTADDRTWLMRMTQLLMVSVF